jgi:hypothetical protein
MLSYPTTIPLSSRTPEPPRPVAFAPTVSSGDPGGVAPTPAVKPSSLLRICVTAIPTDASPPVSRSGWPPPGATSKKLWADEIA